MALDSCEVYLRDFASPDKSEGLLAAREICPSVELVIALPDSNTAEPATIPTATREHGLELEEAPKALLALHCGGEEEEMAPVAVEESDCDDLALIPALHPPTCDNLSEIARPSCAPKPCKATPPSSLHPLLLSHPVCFLRPLRLHPLAWLQNMLTITHIPHPRLRQNILAIARHYTLLATMRLRSAKPSSSWTSVLVPPSKRKCEGPSTPCYHVRDCVRVVAPQPQVLRASVPPYAKALTTSSSPELPMRQIPSHRLRSLLLCHSSFPHICFCPLSRIPWAATNRQVLSDACTSQGNVLVICEDARPLFSPTRARRNHLDLVNQFARQEATEDSSDLSEGEKAIPEMSQATGEVAKLRRCEGANWTAGYSPLRELWLHLRRQAWQQDHSFEPLRRMCSTLPLLQSLRSPTLSTPILLALSHNPPAAMCWRPLSPSLWVICRKPAIHFAKERMDRGHNTGIAYKRFTLARLETSRQTQYAGSQLAQGTTLSFMCIQLPLLAHFTFPRQLSVQQPVSSWTYAGLRVMYSGNSQQCSHSHSSFNAQVAVAAPTEDSRDFSGGEMMRMLPA